MSLSSKDYLDNEKRLAAFFLLHSVTSVEVTFDGSGDSGSIEETKIMQGSVEMPEGATILVIKEGGNVFNEDTKTWETGPTAEKELPIVDAIESHVYAALSDTNVDWYNNDGGFGSWNWTSEHGLDFNVYQRIVQESLEYSCDRHLGQEEEIPK